MENRKQRGETSRDDFAVVVAVIYKYLARIWRRLQWRAVGRVRPAARSGARQSPASTVVPVEVTGLQTDGDRDHNDRNPLPHSVTYLGSEWHSPASYTDVVARTVLSLEVRYGYGLCYFFARVFVRYRPKRDEPAETDAFACTRRGFVFGQDVLDNSAAGDATKHVFTHTHTHTRFTLSVNRKS